MSKNQMALNPEAHEKVEEFSLDMAADFYNRHPGEEARITARAVIAHSEAGMRVTILLPEELELLDAQVAQADCAQPSMVRDLEEGTAIDWYLVEKLPSGSVLDFSASVRVKAPGPGERSVCSAELRDGNGFVKAEAFARISVTAASRYIRYLPEIYHDNSLMNRLLMLFESFWFPVEQQIAQGSNYYDIDLAPAKFLPWLGSWIGVAWDDSLPEERKREMLHSALAIYQRRGSRSAMIDFLKIYTNGDVRIVEHRTQNFTLGKHAHLGHTIALGKMNFPHTFTVYLTIRREDVDVLVGNAGRQAEKLLQQRVEALIESQKPAHTAFRLEIKILEPEQIPA